MRAVTVPIRPALLTDHTDTLRSAAVAGVGLAAFPDWLAAADIAAGRLCRVLGDWRTVESGIFAVYPSNRSIAAKVRVFVEGVARGMKALGN